MKEKIRTNKEGTFAGNSIQEDVHLALVASLITGVRCA